MIPTINHWVGQEAVIKRFKVALEASWNDHCRLPHMLFVGGPGLGKTELAHVAAREMGVKIHERLAQVVSFGGALNGLLLEAGAMEIVFLDEIHELWADAQTVLYRAMEGQQITVHSSDDSTMNMPIDNFTVIGATTDEYRLLPPLRDRFKLILPFEHYDTPSLAKITQQRSQLMHMAVDEDVAEQVSLRGRGTPRLAIRLLEACHRYARSVGADSITMEHFKKTVELEGIDCLGLGPDEQRYLRYLADQPTRSIRLLNLEAVLGIHRRTIQVVIEPFLLRSGLIERAAHGRKITEAGLRHLGLLQQPNLSVA